MPRGTLHGQMCAICGYRTSRPAKYAPTQCRYFCHWIVDGWVGYDVPHKKLRFLTQQGLVLWGNYKSGKMTYKRMWDMARSLGWKPSYFPSEPPCEMGTFHPHDPSHRNCPGCRPT